MFSMLDSVAHGFVIEKAQTNGQKAACWMVTSEDLRAKARQEALDFFNKPLLKGNVLIVPMSEETFDKVLPNVSPHIGLIVASKRSSWEQAELERQRERENETPNPNAWFV